MPTDHEDGTWEVANGANPMLGLTQSSLGKGIGHHSSAAAMAEQIASVSGEVCPIKVTSLGCMDRGRSPMIWVSGTLRPPKC